MIWIPCFLIARSTHGAGVSLRRHNSIRLRLPCPPQKCRWHVGTLGVTAAQEAGWSRGGGEGLATTLCGFSADFNSAVRISWFRAATLHPLGFQFASIDTSKYRKHRLHSSSEVLFNGHRVLTHPLDETMLEFPPPPVDYREHCRTLHVTRRYGSFVIPPTVGAAKLDLSAKALLP